MKKVRLAMGLLLALVLVLAMAVPALAVEFEDIEDTDFEASIVYLSARGIVGGYVAEGSTAEEPLWDFRPDNPLQRQQFAKMAVLTLSLEVTAEDQSSFPDTPAPYDPVNNPLYPGSYVAVAAEQGLIQGYTNGSFGFYDNVTRQQAISIVVRAAGDALAVAPDDYEGELDYSNPFHGANIKKAEYNGLLAGIVDLETWDLTANATRGEAAELLAQLYYRVGPVLKLGTAEAGTIAEYTLAELKALDAVEGYGGTKNSVGTIVPPALYAGVDIKTLIDLAGGGTTARIIAADGYERVLSADTLNGVITVLDPTTGEEIEDYTGTIKVILAYARDSEPLFSGQGPLRVAFVSEEPDQLTTSSNWVSQVIGVVVE
jgi:hypothetical protein